MIELSIVIVSYNVLALLERCLKSIISNYELRTLAPHASAGVTNYEIFVVDNASSDDSAAMVREEFPSVHLIANTENRGFAAANNQAFVKTRGRYVLMLNPDTEVRSGALETLVKFMDTHPRAGACGGKLLYGDGSLQHSAFRFPSLEQIVLDFIPVHWRLTESRINGRYSRAAYARGEPFQIDHPLGADLMVRREVVDPALSSGAAEQVGWLDEQFFIYCEEIDWCIRIKRAGWEIWCAPQAEIVHHEAQSTRQFHDRSFVELWRARFQLFKKHYSPAFRWSARQIVRIGLWKLERQTRAAYQVGQVTQDEMERRLEAYKQVWEIATH